MPQPVPRRATACEGEQGVAPGSSSFVMCISLSFGVEWMVVGQGGDAV